MSWDLLWLLVLPSMIALINGRQWHFMHRASWKYQAWIMGKASDATEQQKGESSDAAGWLTLNFSRLRSLVMDTGLAIPHLPHSQPIGYGQLSNSEINTLDNMLVLNPDIISHCRTLIAQTVGHYRNNTLAAVNPIHWIGAFLNLPREVAKSLGIDTSGAIVSGVVQVIQLLYRTAILGGFLYLGDIEGVIELIAQ